MKKYQSPNVSLLTMNTADIITLSAQASGRGIGCLYSDFQEMDIDASDY